VSLCHHSFLITPPPPSYPSSRIADSSIHSAFIVVDLQLVMKKLTPDEYVLGAINLYLDLLNLFLHILRIMGQRR
jgi:hypothetical protein